MKGKTSTAVTGKRTSTAFNREYRLSFSCSRSRYWTGWASLVHSVHSITFKRVTPSHFGKTFFTLHRTLPWPLFSIIMYPVSHNTLCHINSQKLSNWAFQNEMCLILQTTLHSVHDSQDPYLMPYGDNLCRRSLGCHYLHAQDTFFSLVHLVKTSQASIYPEL